jgi:hypothetical protein
MPPVVRSGDAGTTVQQGTRAIARNMIGQISAPLDQPVLPFDDTWIQEIKVSTVPLVSSGHAVCFKSTLVNLKA